MKSVLPDGNDEATLAQNSVADLYGNTLAAPASLDFFILAGDANHDRHVNSVDFTLLAQNFNKLLAASACTAISMATAGAPTRWTSTSWRLRSGETLDLPAAAAPSVALPLMGSVQSGGGAEFIRRKNDPGRCG